MTPARREQEKENQHFELMVIDKTKLIILIKMLRYNLKTPNMIEIPLQWIRTHFRIKTLSKAAPLA